MNLLNVTDIKIAVRLILKKDIKRVHIHANKKNFKMRILLGINENSNKKDKS